MWKDIVLALAPAFFFNQLTQVGDRVAKAVVKIVHHHKKPVVKSAPPDVDRTDQDCSE